MKSESFTLDSNLPYLLAFVSYRMPGTRQSGFRRGADSGRRAWQPARAICTPWFRKGKALETEFGLAETYPKASVAYSAAVLPADGDAAPVIAEMRKIMSDYAANGVPAELVEAAKRREIAAAEFRRNSIPGLAEAWSRSAGRRRTQFAR